MVNGLIQLFDRDLEYLLAEIKTYKKESDLWVLPKGINNTGGNLCLHVVGNLQHYIGHILGESGYVRNQEAEFSDKNVMVTSLVKEIDTTQKIVSQTLNNLSKEQLESEYPLELFGDPMTTSFFLIHLHSHLNYHIGQINYHRRLLPNFFFSNT
ncbi:MAG: DinB family protein [Cyclobacteriaceae bacterium]|nr:DinB family protein [Cyclobacteriaceae bacterium]